jgi:hypothetical protein
MAVSWRLRRSDRRKQLPRPLNTVEQFAQVIGVRLRVFRLPVGRQACIRAVLVLTDDGAEGVLSQISLMHEFNPASGMAYPASE